jgi:Flp pilus assembly pilin Flp
MSILNRFWNDEAGVIISAELVLVLTILVIGMIVGLNAVRTSVVQELGDIAEAFGIISQTYSYGGVTHCCGSTPGSQFTDAIDDCDPTDDVQDAGTNVVGACILASSTTETGL